MLRPALRLPLGALCAGVLALSPSAEPGASASAADSAEAFAAWRSKQGPSWRLVRDDANGSARFLHGGRAQGAFRPVTDEDYALAARGFIDATAAVFDLSNDELVLERVVLVPLAAIGSTDKINVRFVQALNGVPAEGASVNVLLTPDGDLLSLDAQALPGLAAVDTLPSVPAEAAREAARMAFAERTGTPATRFSPLALNLIRVGSDTPALAWRVQVWNETAGFLPESFVFQVAAQDAPRVLRADDAIHHFDVGGTVSTNATPGHKPDTASNPPVAMPAAYMTVTAQGVGSTTTDASGNFNFAGVNGPVNVTLTYNGLYNNVDNSNGAEYSLTTSLTGTGNAVLLNPSPNGDLTAQSNAFQSINEMRDWTRSVNPADGAMDFVNLANVNITSSCNAFYDGSSTNYYRPGGGCVNTAYETVIYHEQGHWQNDRYGSGNGFDGFGEGNADAFAIFQADTPLLGEDFFGTGTTVRDARNLRQYCGDGNGGCYGEVHNDGEVLMGAFWKVREEIRATLGTPGAIDVTNGLFLGWMNAYDQKTIHSIIESQWLTLDDDNGDLNDGTPNYQDIDDGFRIQGFPGVVLGGGGGGGAITKYGENAGGANIGMLCSASDPVAGQTMTFDVSGIPSGTNGILWISLTQVSTPFRGGTLLAQLSGAPIRLPVALVGGAQSINFLIPGGASGRTVFSQAAVLDATASQGISFTNGLQIDIAP